MFQFPAFLPHTLCVQVWVTSYDGCRVPPFGYRRIFASLPLPVAFRRSVRPSSVPSGQAFAVRPSLLDLLLRVFRDFFFLLFNTQCLPTTFRYRPSVMSLLLFGFQRSTRASSLESPTSQNQTGNPFSSAFSLERR